MNIIIISSIISIILSSFFGYFIKNNNNLLYILVYFVIFFALILNILVNIRHYEKFNSIINAKFYTENEINNSYIAGGDIIDGTLSSKIYNKNNKLAIPISNIKCENIAQIGSENNNFNTGVDYFKHYNSNNITLIFSAGRHEVGYNSYVTIDLNKENPFDNIHKPICIGDHEKCSMNDYKDGYSWVSVISSNNIHYALFSGDGSHRYKGHLTPSILYRFIEDENGNIELDKTPLFIEKFYNNKKASRFCLLEYCGHNKNKGLYNTDYPDIIITGENGLIVYSYYPKKEFEEYIIYTSQSLYGSTSNAYVGCCIYKNRYLIVGNRSRWNNINAKHLDAPNIVFDIHNSKIVYNFANVCQTVSINILNNDFIILGNGGEANITGSPNIIYKITNNNNKLVLNKASKQNQLSKYINTECNKFRKSNFNKNNEVPDINNTKTRLVLPFRVNNKKDYILVINSGQKSYIWTVENNKYKNVILLNIPNSNLTYPRGGTVISTTYGSKIILYVIIAMYNHKNIVSKIIL